MIELLYALDRNGKMVHINSVPNGLACGCRCPGCGAWLIAKNNGETVSAHFAHASGVACAGAHESELHLLAKEIISTAKRIMLPAYGNVYHGGVVTFDEVEVEERNDFASLQPDLCGVVHNTKIGKDSRLWIEIRVTHAIGLDKRCLIEREGIACVEIDLSQFINAQVTKELIQQFLLDSKSSREWTNNPVLERNRMNAATAKREFARKVNDSFAKSHYSNLSKYEIEQQVKSGEQIFLKENRNCCIVEGKSCYKCMHHSTRIALFEEAKRLHLPVWVREALSSNLKYWTKENVGGTVTYENNFWSVAYDTYMHLLPLDSPNVLGQEVSKREIKNNERCLSFLLDRVPAIIASEGLKCKCCVRKFNEQSSHYSVVCNMPNVVNKHRRK